MKNLYSMELKDVEDYLGITDNNDYMYKAKTILDFRLLSKLCAAEDVEIILSDDFYNLKLDKVCKIFYIYKNLIAYRKDG